MSRLRIVLATLIAAGALGGVAGLAVVFLGLYNTSAQQEHWPITGWALHTTFENSVALRAPPLSRVPADLDDLALIELGARHYDSACRMCHASPGRIADATIASMAPRPPQIEEAVAPWNAAEMHWIVHEGVKMSGMPAWPAAGREDEVWAVVAFLTAVQRGMSVTEYAGLTAPTEQGYCAGCHGAEGTRHAPRLDILTADYIEMSIDAYRTGQRASGIMQHAVGQIDPADDARVARALAALPSPARLVPATPTEAGEAIAQLGTRGVPACLSCHGPQNTNPLIPRLDGQHRDYLVRQLILWREGARGGGNRAVLMHAAAEGLSDAQIEDLAAYFAARGD